MIRPLYVYPSTSLAHLLSVACSVEATEVPVPKKRKKKPSKKNLSQNNMPDGYALQLCAVHALNVDLRLVASCVL